MSREKTNLKVFRFNPDKDEKPYYKTYEVPVAKGMTVTEALFYVMENLDGSLAFRYNCRAGICGSCAMLINGKYRLACETQLAALNSKLIQVEPLPHYPPIKDLVVDLEPFLERYKAVKPYIMRKEYSLDRQRLQKPREFERYEEYTQCIMCASCVSACPTYWTSGYLGPLALIKSYRFLRDSSDEGKEERISTICGEEGVWRCHTVFECTESCPKNIQITSAIEFLKRMVVVERVKSLFRRRKSPLSP